MRKGQKPPRTKAYNSPARIRPKCQPALSAESNCVPEIPPDSARSVRSRRIFEKFGWSVTNPELRQPSIQSEGAAGADNFGRYRVVRPLGEGGMGTVYLAEQLEPIRRRVALKVVKVGMDTAQVLARFHNERQAAGDDGPPEHRSKSSTPARPANGRPYFVMEYTSRAHRLPKYCDRERMTTRRRLARLSSAQSAARCNMPIRRV